MPSTTHDGAAAMAVNFLQPYGSPAVIRRLRPVPIREYHAALEQVSGTDLLQAVGVGCKDPLSGLLQY
jgi:hypothetical protein